MSQPDLLPVERTLYLGRRRLGRFVQIGENQFEGFGPDDQILGHFTSNKAVLRAIRDAQCIRLDCTADAFDEAGAKRRLADEYDAGNHIGLHDRPGDRP